MLNFVVVFMKLRNIAIFSFKSLTKFYVLSFFIYLYNLIEFLLFVLYKLIFFFLNCKNVHDFCLKFQQFYRIR